MLLEYGEVKVEIQGGNKALKDPQQFITLTSGADNSEFKNNINLYLDKIKEKLRNI
jgi:hypothetical protein